MSTSTPGRLPHDPWAEHYESVMHQTYGELYTRMTGYTMAEVDRLVPSDATVVDLGAGAGRMSIPLARSGRSVLAVERSARMIQALEARRAALDPVEAARVEVRPATIQSPGPLPPADLVLCVFTVIAYCTTEVDLLGAFRSAVRALTGTGPLLLDVPQDEVFESVEVETGDLIRDVTMTERGEGRYRYRERTLVRTPHGSAEYTDEFELRRWSLGEVERLLREAGFASVEDVTDRFPGLGARYLVARCEDVSSTAG